jgi:hypothetical protein
MPKKETLAIFKALKTTILPRHLFSSAEEHMISA